MMERIPKIVIETGFCVMSETEFKMTFEIEENIVCPVYRVVRRDARMAFSCQLLALSKYKNTDNKIKVSDDEVVTYFYLYGYKPTANS